MGDTAAAAFFSPRCATQRIVELSQATAKLSSEGANTRARAADAEDTMEKIAHDLEVSVYCSVCPNSFTFRPAFQQKKNTNTHMHAYFLFRTGVVP